MSKEQNNGKILVVDDNLSNIQVIGTILKKAKYDVGFAMNGEQALDLLRDSSDFDLVLLDIKMPGLNGFDVCKIMQNDDHLKEIPVVFLSASNDTASIIEGFDTGALDYVTKPFNSKELLARVNTHVQLNQRNLEVNNYSKELEKLNATKDKFFSIIAHDLRNPFESILLLTNNLLNKITTYSDDEIAEKIKAITAATENGSKLLENLLTWSRSQTGHITFNPEEISLGEIIQKNIDLVRPQADVKNINIIFIQEGDITVKTDKAMFLQILRNLLTNAMKFTADPGTITITTLQRAGMAEISVSDTGLGISESDKKRLFRIDGNITSRKGTQNEVGSGLGLILCKEFVDKLGGSISVESQPGKGSTFTFEIPVNGHSGEQ